MTQIRSRPLIGCTTYRKDVPHSDIYLDGLMPTYTRAILEAGGLPVLIPISYHAHVDQLNELFDRVDGLLMPGGGDINPVLYAGEGKASIYGIDDQRDQLEMLLARRAVAEKKPLLAICRGHQLLNVALGGTLWEDVLEMMPKAIMHAYFRGYPRDLLTHTVEICADSRLAEIMGAHKAKPVNSIHHQGIRELAPGLTPNAYAPDGLIEGVEIKAHPFALGLQWHPEELALSDPETLAVFQAFVDSCR